MHFPGFLDLDIVNLIPKDGVVEYFYPFYNDEFSKKVFTELLVTTSWKEDQMKMYDRMVDIPRLTCWYGEGTPWPLILQKLKGDVEKHTGVIYNSVLLNLYRNNFDHVSWHSDRASHPDENKIITSLTFGEERKFQLRHKTDKSLGVITLNLKSGSLVVMKNIQENWQHRIARTAIALGPRINLTFRITHKQLPNV